ncbi:MAG: hypothetical protein KF850_06480 [Labilithrix sp.]|nr:hypothetical protein [Labilithrix sp.]
MPTRRSNPRPWATAAMLLGVVSGVALAGVADAAPIAADKLTQPKRALPRAGVCGYKGALAALPAGCTAAPTLANCLDPAYLAGTCGRNVEIIQKQYCQKALVEEYCRSGPPEEELVFPVASPKNATVQGYAAGTPSLFIPPGQAMGGKQMPFTGLTRSAPFPATPNAATAISQGHGATRVELLESGKGTYTSTTAGQWLAQGNAARSPLFALHGGLLRGMSAAQLEPQANQLWSGIDLANTYVGNGANTAANRAVSSCGEFAYQRWYDFTRFKGAAKAVGRDYRAVYALALDPGSPYNLEKATLKQFATGDLPSTWPRQNAYKDATVELPRNAFFATPSFTADVPQAKVNEIQARIDKYMKTSDKRYIRSPGGSRFALHKRLRDQIEARYKLSDDGFDERTARKARYMELVSAREEVASMLACATVPHMCCSAPPTNTPNALHDLLLTVKGWTVINPDPTKLAQFGADVGPIDWYNEFVGTEQLQLSATARALKQNIKNIDGKVPGTTSLKSKVPVGQATQGQASQAALASRGVAPSAQAFGGGTCESKWAAKLPSLQASMRALVTQLSDLVVKEFDAGPTGCLADPGSDLGNSCDWSYQSFARFVTSYFDHDVQQSFDACNQASRGSFTNVRDQNKQSFIWPCEVRHDFGVDQVDTQYFIDTARKVTERNACEGQRAQAEVDAYLRNNAALVEKIPTRGSKIGESSGDTWTIGDRGTFGSYLEYGVGWEMSGHNNAKTSDGAWCKPVGASNLSGKAGFHFFGKKMRVLEGSSVQETTSEGSYYTASAKYADMSSLGMRDLFPPAPRTKMFMPTTVLPTAFALLGGARADFWASVGPVPLHIFFGANAIAGLSLKEIGTPTTAASCATPTKPSEQIAMGFSSGTEFEPWTRADAFADASLDVGLAAAGVHIDLLLIRLGLPTGASVAAANGGAVKMQTGSTLSVDALSGRVSAYVRIGVPPLSTTWEATLFSWDGLHDSTLLFGSAVTAPIKLTTWTAQSQITPAQVVCLNKHSPASNVPNDRSWCLKNPTTAANCTASYPAPDYCNATQKFYRLRGP